MRIYLDGLFNDVYIYAYILYEILQVCSNSVKHENYVKSYYVFCRCKFTFLYHTLLLLLEELCSEEVILLFSNNECSSKYTMNLLFLSYIQLSEFNHNSICQCKFPIELSPGHKNKRLMVYCYCELARGPDKFLIKIYYFCYCQTIWKKTYIIKQFHLKDLREFHLQLSCILTSLPRTLAILTFYSSTFMVQI